MLFNFNKSYQEDFSWKSPILFIALSIYSIFHVFWACFFPLSDIESYYWDWSRHLSLGYYDHPGAVAWLCRLGIKLTGSETHLRFMVPIFSLFSLLFLIQSLKEIQFIKKQKTTLKQVLFLIITTGITPVFAVQSFVLMPDFSLLFAISICLFISLKIITHMKKLSCYSFLLFFLLGFFSGFGCNSKYHMIPIIFCMLLAIYIIKKPSIKVTIFFIISFLIGFIITVWPVVYWNLKNNGESVLFQLSHGFNPKDLSISNVFRFIFESSIYITPVLYVYWIYNLYLFIKNKKTNNISLLYITPISVLFIVFFIASFFSYTAPYWLSPAFFLILPFFASSMCNWKYNKIFITLFATVTIVAISFTSIKECRDLLNRISNGHLAYKILFWDKFDSSFVEKAIEFKLPKSISPERLKEQGGCKSTDTVIASRNWMWTAQLAQHLSDFPYVYNLNDEKSFYSYRSDLNLLKGCHIIIIAPSSDIDVYIYNNIDIYRSYLINAEHFKDAHEFSVISVIFGVVLNR